MCDTIVAVSPSTADGAVWFGKNSDREPGEAQIVERIPSRKFSTQQSLQCTYLEIPQASRTYEIVISRPFWMWGAEMGANEYGVAIGNEAVFTRLPVPAEGLTGMDLLRIALERSQSAREALELITRLIDQFSQGGLCGYRHKGFRYHNSFIIADPTEAWVLETAGRFWAAEKVREMQTISNVLTIGKQFDLISPGAREYAVRQGWCRSIDDFDFAKSFGDPFYRMTSGGELRRACTYEILNRSTGKISRETIFGALRDHSGVDPSDGWRMKMPCAHASWQVARRSGQTTGSMVSRLSAGGSRHFLTGTSSPCLSVFKPVILGNGGNGILSRGPAPGEGDDGESLFWRHERLHRLTLPDYAVRKNLFENERAELESQAVSSDDCNEIWETHRNAINGWIDRVKSSALRNRQSLLAQRYWKEQNRLDKLES